MRFTVNAFLIGLAVLLAFVVMDRKAKADSFDEAIERASEALQKGDFSKAIEDLTVAIRLKPDADVYNLRGLAYGKKGDHDKEIADFSEAIRLKPGYAEAYRNRGAAYGNMRDYDKAIVDFTEAIRFKADYAEAYYNRGLAYRKKGENGKADADFAAARRPGNRAADMKPTPGFDVMSRDGDRFVEGRMEAVPSSNSAKIIVQARNVDLATENGRKKAEAEIDDATNVCLRGLSKSPPFRDQPLRETQRQDSRQGTTLRREVLFDTRMRTWTDSTGTHHVEAEFVEVKDKTVGLKKKDGTALAVPLARLSAADHEYIGLLLLCSDVNDETLTHLDGLSGFQSLNLSSRHVTDAGLEHLKELSSVRSLDLSNTGVTDAGLEHLNGLKGLRSLDLRHTKVTDQGVNKLQQALPDCKIETSW